MILKDLYITQNSYYFVHRHFIKFFESENSHIIFVSENKRGIKKKYIEIYQSFGIINFVKCIFLEIIFFIILNHRKRDLISFNVSDDKLNTFLKEILKVNKYKRIVSIGCPTFISPYLGNYDSFIYNVHGGILPFQKGRFSPLKSMKKGHKYLGASIHIVNNNFDEGKVVSQDFFKIKNKNKLSNYNKVLILSSNLLKGFIQNNFKKLPNYVNKYFKEIN